jgi:hypothetical protein
MVGSGMGRAPLVAALTAAFYVVVLYTVKTVPDWAVGMLGGPQRPIERLGGLTAWWKPPEGGEEAYRHYVENNVVRREGGLVVLEFPGLSEEAVPQTVAMLAHGGVVFKEVIDGTQTVIELASAAGLPTEIKGPDESDDVGVEIDQWRPDDGGALHTDYFLHAPSAEAMQRVVDAALAAGFKMPEGTELAYEWVEPNRDDRRPYIRSYLVSTEVGMDGSTIADATGSYDPNTGRPIVLLDFNREGAQRFCDLTGRIVGHKLATILDGTIKSAPIINSRICGGKAMITMGGADAERQERERDATVGALRMGSLPAGGTIERKQWKPAPDARVYEWLARLLFGVVTGAVVGGLALLTLRLTRPAPIRRLERIAGGNKLTRRVLVTAIAPVALWLGAKITLPWVNDVELDHIVAKGGSGGGGLGTQFSVIAIGITPIIFAYALVELAALAVPAWRWRRFDPLGRAGLGRAVAVIALVVAAIQAYFVWSYLDSMGGGGYGVRSIFGGGFGVEVITRGPYVKWLVIATLVAGTCLLALVAGLVTEHGLGNGYAALLASSFLLDVLDPFFREGIDGFPYYVRALWHPFLLGLVATFAIALATRALLRRRVDDVALPTSGIAPFGDSASVIALLLMLYSLVAKDPLQAQQLVYKFYDSTILHTAVILASIPIWAWLFARPSHFALLARRSGVPSPTYRTWLRATGLGFAALVAIYAVGQTLAGHAGPAFVPATIMIATAAVLDIRDDVRARRRDLVIVGVVHHAQHAGVLERLLADAKIPAHFQARNIRTLFSFFGPWAPIVVYAPVDMKEAAVKKYEQWRSDLTVFD